MSLEDINELVGRRYRILKVIGQGGLGTVFRAVDTRLQRLVALKVLHVTTDTGSKQRFLREARALASLNHRNILQIYDVGDDRASVYLAVEYVDGRTLRQVIVDAGELSVDYGVEIVFQTGIALAYAHRRGIIHRDVKPENILISKDGRVLLSDFGLAITPDIPMLSDAKTIVGTPAYMSPEQVLGKPVDTRSDIFSLGIVFYELLTGQRPFSGDSLTVLIHNIVENAPATPRSIRPSIPLAIDEIVMKLLAKQPDKRFQGAEQVLSALATATQSQLQAAIPEVAAKEKELSPTLIPTYTAEARPSAAGVTRRLTSSWLVVVSVALVLGNLAIILYDFKLGMVAFLGTAIVTCLVYFLLPKRRQTTTNFVVKSSASQPPPLDRRGGVEGWDTVTATLDPYGASPVPETLKIAQGVLDRYTQLSFDQRGSRTELPVEVRRRLEEFEAIWDQLTRSARHD